jgi:hypothetical protein
MLVFAMEDAEHRAMKRAMISTHRIGAPHWDALARIEEGLKAALDLE